MRRWKWLLSLSCVTSVIAIYPLQRFLRAQPIAIAGRRSHFSPTSVSASSLSLSLERSHYWCLWKWNEWERKGMDGRSWPQGLWGVRTHKLITWYWWRTAHLNHHLYPSALPPPPVFALTTQASTKVWGRSNFLLKWCSQTAINNTFEGNSVWSPEINMIRKWRRRLNTEGQISMPSLWYYSWMV